LKSYYWINNYYIKEDNMTPTQQLIVGLNQAPLFEVAVNQNIHHAISDDWHALVLGAHNDGIDLTIASAFRSFDRQQLIWNHKANGLRPVKDFDNNLVDPKLVSQEQLLSFILHWSALPGASRHHWGTDMDIYAPSMLTDKLQLEPWEYQAGGPMEKLGIWLDDNLTNYGFYRPYHQFNGGVAIEPWHISHVEQSQILFYQLNIQLLEQVVTQHDIGLKELVLDKLDHIYNQYVINVERP